MCESQLDCVLEINTEEGNNHKKVKKVENMWKFTQREIGGIDKKEFHRRPDLADNMEKSGAT